MLCVPPPPLPFGLLLSSYDGAMRYMQDAQRADLRLRLTALLPPALLPPAHMYANSCDHP